MTVDRYICDFVLFTHFFHFNLLSTFCTLLSPHLQGAWLTNKQNCPTSREESSTPFECQSVKGFIWRYIPCLVLIWIHYVPDIDRFNMTMHDNVSKHLSVVVHFNKWIRNWALTLKHFLELYWNWKYVLQSMVFP